MKTKPLVPREQALRDVDDALAHYLAEAGTSTALAFVDALERAFSHVSKHPASGSPRFGHELDLPGLRSWRLRGFPHIVFYMEHADHVDVWRVLHERRDMAAWLERDDDEAL